MNIGAWKKSRSQPIGAVKRRKVNVANEITLPIPNGYVIGFCACLIEGFRQSQFAQNIAAAIPYADYVAMLAPIGHSFNDVVLYLGVSQKRGKREARDAAADDQDFHARLSRFRANF